MNALGVEQWWGMMGSHIRKPIVSGNRKQLKDQSEMGRESFGYRKRLERKVSLDPVEFHAPKFKDLSHLKPVDLGKG